MRLAISPAGYLLLWQINGSTLAALDVAEIPAFSSRLSAELGSAIPEMRAQARDAYNLRRLQSLLQECREGVR